MPRIRSSVLKSHMRSATSCGRTARRPRLPPRRPGAPPRSKLRARQGRTWPQRNLRTRRMRHSSSRRRRGAQRRPRSQTLLPCRATQVRLSYCQRARMGGFPIHLACARCHICSLSALATASRRKRLHDACSRHTMLLSARRWQQQQSDAQQHMPMVLTSSCVHTVSSWSGATPTPELIVCNLQGQGRSS